MKKCLVLAFILSGNAMAGYSLHIEREGDYKDTKSCVFNSDGSFKCDITEIGFTEQFGEAQEYQSIGKCFFTMAH